MSKVIGSFILFLTILSVPRLVIAAYVLPYPSYMPGNKLYKISRVADDIKSYWYFGNIAKTKYYLALSDKYLVEAKTLFEYKQYLLATEALDRSNRYAHRLRLLILTSKKENIDISSMRPIIREYIIAHESVLNTLKDQLPAQVLWQPEKQSSVLLPLHELIDIALEERKNINQFNGL
ncbi:hypothetical protein HY086_02050 [Candidatus Gottesmanbacteria bacterium]|nr:hypothetical protein [Candidatus Gottesmanbacteria bacterium]